MSFTSMVIATKIFKSLSPTKLAIMIMTASVALAAVLFKGTVNSWLSFILILTFSSGMMTLFIYASSLSPNEKSKKSGTPIMLMAAAAILCMTTSASQKAMKSSMKTFSSQMILVIMTIVLIATMVSVAAHGFNPNHSLSASF